MTHNGIDGVPRVVGGMDGIELNASLVGAHITPIGGGADEASRLGM